MRTCPYYGLCSPWKPADVDVGDMFTIEEIRGEFLTIALTQQVLSEDDKKTISSKC